jgi:hypothetical protein
LDNFPNDSKTRERERESLQKHECHRNDKAKELFLCHSFVEITLRIRQLAHCRDVKNDGAFDARNNKSGARAKVFLSYHRVEVATKSEKSFKKLKSFLL